jgi:hypothetical protein
MNCLFSSKMDCLLRKGNKIHTKGHRILRPYFSPFSERTDRTQHYPSAGLIYLVGVNLFSFAFFSLSLSFGGSDRNSDFCPFLIVTEILVNRKGMVVI